MEKDKDEYTIIIKEPSRQMKYYQRNKEKVLEKNRKYKRAHLDKLRQYDQKNKKRRQDYFKKLYQEKLKQTKPKKMEKKPNRITLIF